MRNDDMTESTVQPWLSPAENKSLSGYERPAWQRKWFDANGIRYRVNKNGENIVIRADLSKRAPPHDDGELDFEPGQRRANGG